MSTRAQSHATHVSLRNSVDTSATTTRVLPALTRQVEFSRGPLQPVSQPANELGSHLVAQHTHLASSRPPYPEPTTYRSELELATALVMKTNRSSSTGPPFSILSPSDTRNETRRVRVYSGRHRKSRLSKSLGMFFAPFLPSSFR